MESTRTDYSTSASLAALAVFIAIVFSGGATVSGMAIPGTWYAELIKPPFNPPGWIFTPVWITFYVVLAVAGWRVWVAAPRSPALILWATHLLLNWLWTPVFFKAHLLWLAFAIMVATWLAICGFIIFSRRHDTLAPLLFLPYLAWVSFAVYLNLAVAILN